MVKLSREIIENVQSEDWVDSMIAERIMGWKVHPRNTAHWYDPKGDDVAYKVQGMTSWPGNWSPSRNLIKAWDCVQKMRANGWSFMLTHNVKWEPKPGNELDEVIDIGLKLEGKKNDFNGLVQVGFGNSAHGCISGSAEEAPLAICRAILMTLLAKENNDAH